MRSNSELDTILRELESAGVKGHVGQAANNHPVIRWRVAEDKPVRMVVTAATGSDWRGRLNARAVVRRYLREDGAYLAPAATSLAKAIASPKPTLPVGEQLLDLRTELSDITDLLFEIVNAQAAMIAAMSPSGVVARAVEIAGETKTPKRTVPQIVLDELIYGKPLHVQDIAKKTGKSPAHVSIVLVALKKNGVVSNPSRGLWQRTSANGHASHH